MQPTPGIATSSEYTKWLMAKIPLMCGRNGDDPHFLVSRFVKQGVNSYGIGFPPLTNYSTTRRLVLWNDISNQVEIPYASFRIVAKGTNQVVDSVTTNSSWVCHSQYAGSGHVDLRLTKFLRSCPYINQNFDNVGSIPGNVNYDDVILVNNVPMLSRIISVDIGAAFRCSSASSNIGFVDMHEGEYSTEGQVPTSAQAFWNASPETMTMYYEGSNTFRLARSYMSNGSMMHLLRQKFINVGVSNKMYSAFGGPIVRYNAGGLDIGHTVELELTSLYVCVQLMEVD